MSEFSYSTEAKSIRRRLLGVDAVVYVEGDDDVPFWRQIFSYVPDFKVEVEPLGGSSNIDEVINEILSSGLKAIVARDRDYLNFKNGLVDSPLVLYTKGYSIENTLVCEKSVTGLLENYLKGADFNFDYQEWIFHMDKCLRDMVVVDCLSICRARGFTVFKGCDEFSNGAIDVFDEAKCRKKRDELLGLVDEGDFRKFYDAMSSFPIDKIFRGHLLIDSVRRLVKSHMEKFGKRGVLDKNAIFSSLMFCLRLRIAEQDGSVLEYVSMAKKAALGFKNLVSSG